MNSKKMNIPITITAIILILAILDFLWLGLIAKNLYANQIGPLMKTSPNLFAAFFVYLALAAAIFIFVLNNNLTESPASALIVGSILGLTIYGIYDLTNYALLKSWPLKITIIDIFWGTFLVGTTSFIAKHLQNLIN